MTEELQPFDFVLRNVKLIPDEIAITDGERTLTWQALFELTKRMARELRDRGIQPGDVIGVRLPPMLTCLVTWAIFHEAAVFIAFNSDMIHDERLSVRLVISNKPVDGLSSGKNLVVSNEWFEKIHMNSTIIEQNRYPSSDAVFRFSLSSGTTGRSKTMVLPMAVVIERAALAFDAVHAKNIHMNLNGSRTEGGFYSFFGSAMAGKTYLVPNRAKQNIGLLTEYQVDVVKGSPLHLSELASELDRSNTALPNLRLILSAGSQLPAALFAKLKQLTGAVIGNAYGSTELLSVAMRWSDAEDPSNMGTIFPGTTVEVVDEKTHEPVPDGDVGLIRARRALMPTAYLNDPDASAISFREGWFYPGDYGLLKDNTLYLHGRASEIINSGGLKTDPLLVEEAYAEFEDLQEYAAFGLPDREGIPRIALAYVADREFTPEFLRGLVLDKLGFRTPDFFFRIDKIPRGDGMQKVQRVRLTEQFAGRAKMPAASIPNDVNSPAAFTQPFDYVTRAFERSPDGPAVVNVNRTSSWKDLYLGAKRLAVLLRERGVVPGDIVAVNLPSALSFLVTLAVFHEAAVIAPFVIAMARPNPWGVKWLVTTERIDAIPAHQQIVIDSALLEELWRIPLNIAPRRYPTADSLQRLAFSSGTTGTPKAIPFTVAQTEMRALDHESRTMSTRQSMSLMTPRLGMGWWPWYASILTQRPYIKPGTPENNLRLLRRMRVDSVMGSPAQLSDIVTLLRQSNTSLPDISVVQSGGSQLSLPLHDALKELTGATIMNAYGSTEVGPTTLRTDDDADPSYVGEILPGAIVEIVDPESGTALPEGNTGLVRVRRHTMVDGYYHEDEATARSWRDGWFYAGDYGHLVGNRLYIEGREGEIINIGGSKVDPASIDKHFASYPMLTDHAAFGVIDDVGIERVALAYVSNAPINDTELIEKSKPSLRDGAPVFLWRVDQIPRNEMGKPLRSKLRETFRAAHNNEAIG
ncbi:MAG: acyl--CoA ligase [Microbacteriaceae bacterium]|nr:acyl--CoA ligase [Microbacteriaceae bacterium]